MCCRILTDLKWVILGDAEMISIDFGTVSDLPERVSDGSDMFMKCLLTLHLTVSSSLVLVSPSSSFLRTDARARTLQRAPRKSGKFTQAESLLQDAREKPANDVLPGGSNEPPLFPIQFQHNLSDFLKLLLNFLQNILASESCTE